MGLAERWALVCDPAWDYAAGMDQGDQHPVPVGVAALVAALPDPSVVLDDQGLVLHANEAAFDLIGALTLGQPLAHSLRAPALLAALSQTLADRQMRHASYETRGTTPRQFEALVAAIAGGGPAAPALLVQIRDLTREQQVERMRADFVANASHELRTPLASLTGFIDTLKGAARDDARAREQFLDLMQAQANRMKRLIDDLLSLSRIEMNEHLRPSTALDLAAVLRQAADLLAHEAQRAATPLNLHLATPLRVKGEREELVQVFYNLIENALKYGAGARGIDISAARDRDQVIVSGTDHGPGCAEIHLPRLTERFYRVSVQDSRSRGGTGLGLAIVKHILNRHGARLTITSTPGEGSTFRALFPASE